jgi:hypothetical protein
MTHREQLWAYLATLAALVIIFVAALIGFGAHPEMLGKGEMFGLGTLFGGLIGILRLPSSRSVTVDNPPTSPVPVEPNP